MQYYFFIVILTIVFTLIIAKFIWRFFNKITVLVENERRKTVNNIHNYVKKEGEKPVYKKEKDINNFIKGDK